MPALWLVVAVDVLVWITFPANRELKSINQYKSQSKGTTRHYTATEDFNDQT